MQSTGGEATVTGGEGDTGLQKQAAWGPLAPAEAGPANAAPGPSPTVGRHRVVPEGPWASASSPGFFRSPEPGARPMTVSGEGSLVKRRRETLKNRKPRGWEKNQPAPLRVHENRLPLCRGRCRHLGALCAPN